MKMLSRVANLKFTLLAALFVACLVVGSGFVLGVRPSFIRGAEAEDPYARCSISEKEHEGDQVSLVICENGKPLPPEVEEKIRPRPSR